jgi:hypothetical protein
MTVQHEQRANPRVAADFAIEFHAGPGPAGAGTAVNVSVGGLMMQSSHEVAVGATLALRFRLSASDPQQVTVRSRIVARQAAGGIFHYNIAFFNVEAATRSRIGRFVTERTARL